MWLSRARTNGVRIPAETFLFTMSEWAQFHAGLLQPKCEPGYSLCLMPTLITHALTSISRTSSWLGTWKQRTRSSIWSCNGSENVDCVLLGCDAFLIFRESFSPLSSRYFLRNVGNQLNKLLRCVTTGSFSREFRTDSTSCSADAVQVQNGCLMKVCHGVLNPSKKMLTLN